MIGTGRRPRGRGKQVVSPGPPVHPSRSLASQTLLDVPVGYHARVQGLSSAASQMQAYGLSPGYWVRVLQHSPVTIIQIDHLELALENELAGQVQVEEISPNR